MINAKYVRACEELDWEVHMYEDGTVALEKHSPAGEDFIFGVSAENFVADVKKFAACFGVYEHVEMRVDGRGKDGIPSSIRELVEDAKAIDKMLQELAAALSKVEIVEKGDEYIKLSKAVVSYCAAFLKRSIYGECKAFCPFHIVNSKDANIPMCSERYIRENPERIKEILEEEGIEF